MRLLSKSAKIKNSNRKTTTNSAVVADIVLLHFAARRLTRKLFLQKFDFIHGFVHEQRT